MERHYYIESYDLMCLTEKIGCFMVEYTESGRSLSMKLDVDLSNNRIYEKLYHLQKDGTIDDDGVRFFISHRVMPRNRINGDSLLVSMGLTEYDQYEIFKYNNGACGKDYFWVRFNEGTTFYDVNPKAKMIMDRKKDVIDDIRLRRNKNNGA